MSKKLKKLLFLGAVVGSAAGAVCYFARKKNAAQEDLEEEDYDDFSTETDTASSHSGSYVPLTPETANAEEAADRTASEEEPKRDETFTPLAEQVASSEDKAEEAVEEFFDEEDSSDAEPPVNE